MAYAGTHNGVLIVGVSFLIQMVGVFMIGPIEGFPNILTVVIVGLIVTGLAAPLSVIPAYEEMKEPFVESTNGVYDNDKLTDILSGLFNAGFSLGTIIGPITASSLTMSYGFRVCCLIIGLFTFGYSILSVMAVKFLNKRH